MMAAASGAMEDVYKRQVYGLCENLLAGGRQSLPTDNPVSYTHLDVYKRQVY